MWLKKIFGSVLEAAAIAAVAIFAVVMVREYVFNPYSIAGASMAPSFHDGDYVVVDQLSYRWRQALRGEVVIFHSQSAAGEDLVKRVIGLPGERVIVKDGQVTIINNGCAPGRGRILCAGGQPPGELRFPQLGRVGFREHRRPGVGADLAVGRGTAGFRRAALLADRINP
jgi:signal peptidase I